uniref:PHD finger protein rhinoceros n=1 Tax=Rhipicephalus pulchellus TaxID=72859 RepID=L7M5T7_RHIPC
MSKIYNSSYRSNKPAELFRKDLISAMKLPDSEPLDADDYWFISDGWKQEWERGVQVPVNPGHLPEPTVKVIKKKSKSNDFKLPPNKYLRLSHDEFFSNDLHVLTNVSALAEKTCRYDLDCLDQQWLRVFNEERKSLGLEPLPELTMEMILEDFETQCYDKLQREIRTEQGLGIEYDEDVVCDVCRSPDSEEGNEMVFCDQCDLCVHQACYGIQRIPEGSWVCRTCALGIRPPCVLCPTRGGAMKSTRSGQKWAHVSCALWIPEVSIGCVEKMEPIMKISQIPPSRWALTCCLCRERIGACIQCSVKACKRAYHVTCAFENGLEMKPIIDDNTVDEVKLKSFCPKHSKKKEVHRKEASSDDSDKKASPVSREGHHQRDAGATNEEKESARLAKIQAIEAEFYKHVSLKETAEAMSTDLVVIDFVYNYWKLKRKANHDKPLLTPLKEETDGLDKLEENNLYSRVKMFVHLRQDLERVRNLCYMVSRREKIAKSLLKTREEIFEHQVAMLKPGGPKMSEREREAVILASQSEHVYDRLVSPDPSGPKPCLRLLLDALEGREVPNLYGLIKKPPSTPTRLPNPYAKQYVNGLRSRRLSMMGGAGESEGCVAQDEDSQGTADSATTVSGRGDVAADQASVRTAHVAAAALETLSEEQLEASEERGQAAGGEDILSRDVAEVPVRVSRSHRQESAEDTPCTLSKSEIGKGDPSDTESRMSTRSRNADTLNEISDTESKISVRSRNFNTVNEISNTEGKMSTRSRHADTVNEINDIEGRVCTRSRTAETVTEINDIEGKSTRSRNAETVNEMSDTEGRMSTRSRNVESGNEISDNEGRMSTRSRNANTVNEISDAEGRKSTRSRTAELLDEISDTEGRVSTHSRNAESVNEVSDTEGRMLTRSRNADIGNEISDVECRLSTRSRNADSGNEISDTEGSMSIQSQNADTANEVSDSEGCMLIRSRNADSGNEISDTECRMSTRSQNVENRNEIGEIEGRMATRSRNTDSVNELKKEDLSDTESRMPTRSRNADAVINAIREDKRADDPVEAECKAQRRSRRLGSVDSVRSTSKGETRKEEIGIVNNRTPTRSRRPETDQSMRSHSSIESKDDTLDIGNRTATRCKRPESSDSMPKGSPRVDTKENEQGDAGSKTPTRSRRCEISDDGLRSLLKSEMHQKGVVKSECKISHQSRKHEQKTEVDEQKAPLLRNEAKSEESDVGSRSSSRSRRCDVKLEQAQDAIKASKTTEGEADEIRKGECKPSMRSRRLEVRNEVADGGTRGASRQEAKKGDTSEADGRVSVRSRRADVLVEASGDLCKVALRQEAKRDDAMEQASRKFGRTTRLSEARIELVPCDMREFLKNPCLTDEVETKSGSRSRRLRKQTTASSDGEDPQPPTLASLCEFPEELNDVGRCTRSSTMQKQEDARGLEEASSREPAGNTTTAASNYGKHTSDENVPKRPDRRERRDSVPCNVPLSEALSPPRASSLSGYRIPKKAKAPNGMLEDRRGSSPVSPLHEVPSHCYAGSDGYTRGRSHVVNVRRPVLGHHCEGRGGAYVERWKRDLDFAIPTGNSAAPDWTGKMEVKENGSRYPMRYRPRFGGKDS